jgi:two-component system response regulator MtrA
MKKILIVEDEEGMLDGLAHNFRYEGYDVLTAKNGQEGLRLALKQKPDAVLLDIMLPEKDGFTVLKELRQRHKDIPVLVMTARNFEADVLKGFDLGADDYVTKPFELPELVARIKAVLRRSTAGPADGAISVAGLEIDPAAFSVRKGGEDIALTATEFRLLLELARRPKQVFTRELLLELVWNYDYLGDSRLVDVAVQRLRGKIEDDPAQPKLIQTVRGVGYRFGQG